MKIKKIITTVAVVGLFAAAGITAYVYNKAFTPNTTFNQKEVFVYIPTNATYEMVQKDLHPVVDITFKNKRGKKTTKRIYFDCTKYEKPLRIRGMKTFKLPL